MRVRLTGCNLVDNSLARLQEVRGVMDELTALAVARQHDLGVGALCACLSARVSNPVFSPMVMPTGTYPGGKVRHQLASRCVTAREEPEDVSRIGYTLDSQVACADDGGQVVHHEGADIAGSTDVAALCRSPSICNMSDTCYECRSKGLSVAVFRQGIGLRESARLIRTDESDGTAGRAVGELVGCARVGSRGEAYVGRGLG